MRSRLALVEVRAVDERSRRIASRFEVPVLLAALLVIPVIAVEESGLGEPWQTLAGVGNWLIWLVFAAELVVLLAVVPHRRAWLRRHPLEVAIVLLTPPFMPAGLQAARAFRLLRLLRVLLAAGVLRRFFTLEGLRYAALTAAFVVLGGGAAFVAVEDRAELSAWDGLYWALTTVTTVGYGDLSPETDAGRVIAVAVMLTGIGFVAMLTAAVAERFVAPDVHEEVESEEALLETQLAAIDQRLERLERAVNGNRRA